MSTLQEFKHNADIEPLDLGEFHPQSITPDPVFYRLTPTRFHDERETLPNGKRGPKTGRINKSSRIPQVSKELIVAEDGPLAQGRAADRATYFTFEAITVSSLDDLQSLICHKGNNYFVSGAINPAKISSDPVFGGATVISREKGFTDTPRNVIIFDVDGVEAPSLEPAKAADFVRDNALAPEFKGVACAYAATRSHGIDGKARMRLAFMVDRAISLGKAKDWSQRGPQEYRDLIDQCPYSAPQPIYSTIRISGTGLDPFQPRSGQLGGAAVACAPDDLQHRGTKSHDRPKTVHPGAVENSPHMIRAFVKDTIGRDAARFDSLRTRNEVIMCAGRDDGDRYVEPELGLLIVQTWRGLDDDGDSARELLKQLTELGLPDAAELVEDLSRAGADIAGCFEGGDRPVDAAYLEHYFYEGYNGRSDLLGNKWALDTKDGADFEAVADDDADTELLAAAQREVDAGRAKSLKRGLELAAIYRREEAGQASTEAAAETGDRAGDDAFKQALDTGNLDALLAMDPQVFNDSFFEPPAPKLKPKAKRFELFSIEDAISHARHHATPYLIKGLISESGSSLLYAPSNVGKTFVEIDIGFHVAAGISWNGHRVKQGAVLYIAAEGGTITFQRLDALSRKHNVKGVPFFITTTSPDLANDPKDCKALIALVKAHEERTGQKFKLIVIDTLAMALAGKDESSFEGMGTLLGYVNRMRLETGAHIALVHHEGKDASKGARGHTSLIAAVDAGFNIVDGGNGACELVVTKMRDGEKGRRYPFRLDTVHLGIDSDGDAYGSCVVNWGDDDDGEGAVKGSPTQEAVAAWLLSNSSDGEWKLTKDACDGTGIKSKGFSRDVMGGKARAPTSFGTLELLVKRGANGNTIRLMDRVGYAGPEEESEG